MRSALLEVTGGLAPPRSRPPRAAAREVGLERIARAAHLGLTCQTGTRAPSSRDLSEAASPLAAPHDEPDPESEEQRARQRNERRGRESDRQSEEAQSRDRLAEHANEGAAQTATNARDDRELAGGAKHRAQ